MRLRRAVAILIGLTTTVLAVPIAGASAAPVGSASPASRPASGPPAPYLVVLRDGLTRLPADPSHLSARQAAARGEQDAVLARLTGSAPGNVQHFATANAFSATLSPAQADALRGDRAVATVTRDESFTPPAPAPAVPSSTAKRPAAPVPGPNVPASACTGTSADPQLEPEALDTIRARSDNPVLPTAASLGINGAGVKVGIIADSLNPNNADFIRADSSHAIVNFVDLSGSGTGVPTEASEAFGDASTIVAQGRVTYDLANTVDPSVVTLPGGHCYIRIEGVAPAASLVAIQAGNGGFSDIALARSIEYAVTVAHVDVLNESFGGFAVPDAGSRDAVEAFNLAATQAGVTVTVSSGDAGINGTIESPAAGPGVISVGASTTNRSHVQSGLGGSTAFGTTQWENDTVSPISSSGYTQDASGIDLVAPGDANWAVCDPNATLYTGCAGGQIQNFSGTSEASPMTAGTAALVIQAYRSTHGGSSPTVALVKSILTGTTDDLGLPATLQGAGRLNARRAVEAALTAPGATGAPALNAPHVVLGASRAVVAGPPGSAHTATFTATNVGDAPATVTTSIRTSTPTTSTATQVTLNPNAPSNLTTTDPGVAEPMNDVATHLTVPPGTDRAQVAIAWPGTSARGDVVYFSLFDPSGGFVTNSLQQSIGVHYSELTLIAPQPGAWTVHVFTLHSIGVSGTVSIGADFYANTNVPAVGSFTLAPGASRTVTVPVTVPARSGDSTEDLALNPGLGSATIGGISLRSVLEPGAQPAPFTGVTRGGNGRPGSPAQTDSYAIDVPAGAASLNVHLRTDARQNTMSGYLIDPAGLVQIVGSTLDPNTNKVGSVLYLGTARPTAGRWTLVLTVDQTDGRTVTGTYAGTVDLAARGVSAPALPTTGGSIPRGTTLRVPVSVPNTTGAHLYLQADARLAGSTSATLAPAGGTNQVQLAGDPLPVLVPPGTTSLSATLAAPTPVLGELQTGDYVKYGIVGQPQPATAHHTQITVDVGTPTLPMGVWVLAAQPPGPFVAPATGVASATITADTAPFNGDISSSTGDIYLGSTNANASEGNPLDIAPASIGALTVSIKPTAPVGTVVHGQLNLVDAVTGNTPAGVYAVLPYSYTVGPTPTPTPAPTTPARAAPTPTPHSPQAGPTPTPVGLAATGPANVEPLVAVATALLLAGAVLISSAGRITGARRPDRRGRHR